MDHTQSLSLYERGIITLGELVCKTVETITPENISEVFYEISDELREAIIEHVKPIGDGGYRRCFHMGSYIIRDEVAKKRRKNEQEKALRAYEQSVDTVRRFVAQQGRECFNGSHI